MDLIRAIKDTKIRAIVFKTGGGHDYPIGSIIEAPILNFLLKPTGVDSAKIIGFTPEAGISDEDKHWHLTNSHNHLLFNCLHNLQLIGSTEVTQVISDMPQLKFLTEMADIKGYVPKKQEFSFAFAVDLGTGKVILSKGVESLFKVTQGTYSWVRDTEKNLEEPRFGISIGTHGKSIAEFTAPEELIAFYARKFPIVKGVLVFSLFLPGMKYKNHPDFAGAEIFQVMPLAVSEVDIDSILESGFDVLQKEEEKAPKPEEVEVKITVPKEVLDLKNRLLAELRTSIKDGTKEAKDRVQKTAEELMGIYPDFMKLFSGSGAENILKRHLTGVAIEEKTSPDPLKKAKVPTRKKTTTK